MNIRVVKKRITLKSGAILENSNLSFLIWHKTIFLMSATKKGFSVKEMQKQLGLKRYESVWAIIQELPKAMGKRDEKYTFEGMIEMDEGCFTIESTEIEQEKGIPKRGVAGKQNVAIRAKSTPLEAFEAGKLSSILGVLILKYLRVIPLKDLKKNVYKWKTC